MKTSDSTRSAYLLLVPRSSSIDSIHCLKGKLFEFCFFFHPLSWTRSTSCFFVLISSFFHSEVWSLHLRSLHELVFLSQGHPSIPFSWIVASQFQFLQPQWVLESYPFLLEQTHSPDQIHLCKILYGCSGAVSCSFCFCDQSHWTDSLCFCCEVTFKSLGLICDRLLTLHHGGNLVQPFLS